jgi:hypothetical protein
MDVLESRRNATIVSGRMADNRRSGGAPTASEGTLNSDQEKYLLMDLPISLEPAAPTRVFVPPTWTTPEEIGALRTNDVPNFLDTRIPPSEQPIRCRKIEDIKAARARGVKWTPPSRHTKKAARVLARINKERAEMGLPLLTLETLDLDELVEEVHICQIGWRVVRIGKGRSVRYEWEDLGGPCGYTLINRDGYLRHLREYHFSIPRAGRRQRA